MKEWSAAGIAIVAVVMTAALAPASVSAKSKSSTGPATIYDTKPFDIHVSKLPPEYFGCDYVALCNAFRARDIHKGEFETTGEFTQRLAALASKPVLGSIYTASRVAFMYDPAIAATPPSYDADAKMLTLNVDLQLPDMGGEGPSNWDDDNTQSINMSTSAQDEGSYVGENTFGATAKVTVSKATFYQIAFQKDLLTDQYEEGDEEDESARLNILLPMDRDTARAEKNSLRILIIGTLVPPYCTKSSMPIDTHARQSQRHEGRH